MSPVEPRLLPRVHGGIVDAEIAALGRDPRDVVDVSVNVNPYGPTPAMREAIAGAAIERYPDSTSSRARRAIADAARCDVAGVVLGNGAVDLLWSLARVLVGAGGTAVVAEPAFGELRAAAEAIGARVVGAWAEGDDRFAHRVEMLVRTVRDAKASLLYVACPENPTGLAMAAADLLRLADALPDVAIVLDESFLALSEAHDGLHVAMPANVVRVRSLTKDHAIPGLRVGYLVTTPHLARRLEASRPPWSVSAPAQAAAIAAMRESAFVAESRTRLLADRDRLRADLATLHLTLLPTTTFFGLVRVGDASRLRARLLARHGILVRDCASFGLPTFVRLSARPDPVQAHVLRALQEEIA